MHYEIHWETVGAHGAYSSGQLGPDFASLNKAKAFSMPDYGTQTSTYIVCVHTDVHGNRTEKVE